jgi:hypothetical protein
VKFTDIATPPFPNLKGSPLSFLYTARPPSDSSGRWPQWTAVSEGLRGWKLVPALTKNSFPFPSCTYSSSQLSRVYLN